MSLENIFQSYIIRNNIFQLLNDKEKLNFTSCNNFLCSKRNTIIFVEECFIKKEDIFYKYYNQFTTIKVYEIFKFPENLKCLKIEFSLFSNKIKIENDDIPTTLDYLQLDEELFEEYKDKISTNIMIAFNPNSGKEKRQYQRLLHRYLRRCDGGLFIDGKYITFTKDRPVNGNAELAKRLLSVKQN